MRGWRVGEGIVSPEEWRVVEVVLFACRRAFYDSPRAVIPGGRSYFW